MGNLTLRSERQIRMLTQNAADDREYKYRIGDITLPNIRLDIQ